MRDRIIHHSRKVGETLCPFLYQTRTLSRCASLQIQRPTTSVRESVEGSKSHDARDDLDQSDNKGEASSSKHRQTGSTPMKYDFPGSTVTSAERAAFRKLISRFGSTQNMSDPRSRHPRDNAFVSLQLINESTDQSEVQALLDQNIDVDVTRIISLFAPETPEMIQEREDYAASVDTKPLSETTNQPYPAWRVRDAALNALKEISRALNTALGSSNNPTREHLLKPRPVDLVVWQTIESQIFAQMTILQSLSNSSDTTGTSLSISEYQRATLEDYQMLETSPSCLRSLSPRTPLLPLLTILYPASTLLAIRTYLRCLPISPSALALMPQVKAMGTVSYLLTSNVHFFNALMRLYWTVYSDINHVKNILREMKQNHVGLDSGTMAILEDMRRDKDHDLKPEQGVEEAETKDVKTQNVKGRSRQWWQMQGQSRDPERIIEGINS